jgi:predicted dehydrogenase
MNRRVLLKAGMAVFAATLRGGVLKPKRYRVAIIGHGGVGDLGHDWEIAWNHLSNVDVVAVADPDESARRRSIQRTGAQNAYSDYHEMLAREKPDIVTITLRELSERVAMTTAAAQAGAHILMEKPFAASLEDADRIVAVTERHHVKVQVGHTARCAFVTRRTREMLVNGELGILEEIRARGKEDQRAGGEDLLVLGTHTFDLMRYLLGDPEWVFAHMTDRSKDVTVEMEHPASEQIGPVAGDQVAAMFSYQNGVHAYFASKANDIFDGERFGVTLYGSRATVFLPLNDVPSAPPYLLRSPLWVGNGWVRIEYEPGTLMTTREQVNAAMAADLIDAIENDREPICCASDGRWTIEMVSGIYRSQYSGQRVAFPLKRH